MGAAVGATEAPGGVAAAIAAVGGAGATDEPAAARLTRGIVTTDGGRLVKETLEGDVLRERARDGNGERDEDSDGGGGERPRTVAENVEVAVADCGGHEEGR